MLKSKELSLTVKQAIVRFEKIERNPSERYQKYQVSPNQPLKRKNAPRSSGPPKDPEDHGKLL